MSDNLVSDAEFDTRRKRRFRRLDINMLRQLAREGFTAFEISHALETTPDSVKVTACRHRIPLGGQKYLRCHLTPAKREAFRAEAKRRGLSPAALLSAIVDFIVDDNLFDAVLDK